MAEKWRPDPEVALLLEALTAGEASCATPAEYRTDALSWVDTSAELIYAALIKAGWSPPTV